MEPAGVDVKVRIFMSISRIRGVFRHTLYVSYKIGKEVAIWNSHTKKVKISRAAHDTARPKEQRVVL